MLRSTWKCSLPNVAATSRLSAKTIFRFGLNPGRTEATGTALSGPLCWTLAFVQHHLMLHAREGVVNHCGELRPNRSSALHKE